MRFQIIFTVMLLTIYASAKADDNKNTFYIQGSPRGCGYLNIIDHEIITGPEEPDFFKNWAINDYDSALSLNSSCNPGFWDAPALTKDERESKLQQYKSISIDNKKMDEERAKIANEAALEAKKIACLNSPEARIYSLEVSIFEENTTITSLRKLRDSQKSDKFLNNNSKKNIDFLIGEATNRILLIWPEYIKAGGKKDSPLDISAEPIDPCKDGHH